MQPWLERGVTMIKLRIGLDWERALDVLDGVRERLGDDVEIATDGSEFFDTPTAMRIAQRLHGIGASWFEEPVPHTRHSAVAEIAERSPVPIAYGEHIFGPDFGAEALRTARIGVVQPDASIAGGFGPARALGAHAAALGARVAVHHHAGPTSMAANLHLAGSLGAVDVLEYPVHLSHLFALTAPDAALTIDHVVDGELPIPTGPGLGIALDLDRVLSGRLT